MQHKQGCYQSQPQIGTSPGRYVDQGGGKRKGAFAIYLEPWHADIFDWLDLRKNHGKEEVRWATHYCKRVVEGTIMLIAVCAGKGARPLLRAVGQ